MAVAAESPAQYAFLKTDQRFFVRGILALLDYVDVSETDTEQKATVFEERKSFTSYNNVMKL